MAINRTPITYFAGRPELRTSYVNQRGLAARDLGGDAVCHHGQTLTDGCYICRMSGVVLLPPLENIIRKGPK